MAVRRAFCLCPACAVGAANHTPRRIFGSVAQELADRWRVQLEDDREELQQVQQEASGLPATSRLLQAASIYVDMLQEHVRCVAQRLEQHLAHSTVSRQTLSREVREVSSSSSSSRCHQRRGPSRARSRSPQHER